MYFKSILLIPWMFMAIDLNIPLSAAGDYAPSDYPTFYLQTTPKYPRRYTMKNSFYPNFPVSSTATEEDSQSQSQTQGHGQGQNSQYRTYYRNRNLYSKASPILNIHRRPLQLQNNFDLIPTTTSSPNFLIKNSDQEYKKTQSRPSTTNFYGQEEEESDEGFVFEIAERRAIFNYPQPQRPLLQPMPVSVPTYSSSLNSNSNRNTNTKNEDLFSTTFHQDQNQGEANVEDAKDRIIFNEKPHQSNYIRPKEPLQPQDLSNLQTLVSVKNKLERHNSGPFFQKTKLSSQGRPNQDSGSGQYQPFPSGKSAGSEKCSENDDYCEDFSDYPKELLNEVLKNTLNAKAFQQIFGDSTDNSTAASMFDISSRNNLGQEQEIPLCNSREHTIFPKAARNKDNKWMFVVNHDEYIQGVRVEKCINEGSSCQFGEGAPLGYQYVCRQKFIFKKLLAVTPDGSTQTESFRLPSCCVCHMKSNFVTDRFAAPPGKSSVVQESDNQEDEKFSQSTNPPSSSSSSPSYSSSSLPSSPSSSPYTNLPNSNGGSPSDKSSQIVSESRTLLTPRQYNF